jgi:hypothetical protein
VSTSNPTLSYCSFHGLPSALLPSGFPIKILQCFSSPLWVTCPNIIVSIPDHPNNIWWGEKIMKILLCNLLVSCHFHPLEAQESSSAPYFHTPSAYVLSLMRETKDHAHIKQAKLQFCLF